MLVSHHDHSVPAIKARRREVIVQETGVEAWEAIEVVLRPLPDVAIDVVEPHGIWWVHVDRLKEKRPAFTC